LPGRGAIDLTVKEFDLLKYLLSHPRQVFTRDQILEKVWGYDFVGDSNVIEVYIRYLRLKLEENNEKRSLHTVRGVGYVLREWLSNWQAHADDRTFCCKRSDRKFSRVSLNNPFNNRQTQSRTRRLCGVERFCQFG
jgi:DNA-binding winged helix-turn-helix (wHTH) protein